MSPSPRSSRRIALYARVSTEKQAQSHTIDSQVSAIKERISQEGMKLEVELCFCDDGISGETLERPALERLRDQAAAGEIDCLYVHSPDRLARKYAFQVLLVEELRRAGVEVVFLNHPVAATPEGELLLQVQGVIAEYERAKILERHRRGKRQAAKSGAVSVFSQAPYGYRYIDKRTGGGEARFEILPEEAEVVRNVFDWFVRERCAISAIARRLTAAKIPTRRGKACWSGSMIWNVLRQPAYQGKAIYGRRKQVSARPRLHRLWKGAPRKNAMEPAAIEDRIEIAVPAIVDPELFAKAQEQLEENRRRCRTGRDGPRHLLQGLVVCQRCGHSFVYFTSGGVHARRSGVAYFYYRCTGMDSHRWGGQRLCSGKMLRADALEKAVWQDVCSVLSDPDRLEREFQRRAGMDEKRRERLRRPIEQLLDRVRRSISRLIDAYQDALITKGEFEARLRKAREREAALAQQQAEAMEREQREQHCQEVLGHFREFAERIRSKLSQADMQAKIHLVRMLIQRIEVDDEEVRIIYKIGQRPFDQGPLGGRLQHRPRRTRHLVQEARRGNLRVAEHGHCGDGFRSDRRRGAACSRRRPRRDAAAGGVGAASRRHRSDARQAPETLPEADSRDRQDSRVTPVCHRRDAGSFFPSIRRFFPAFREPSRPSRV
jgi:site-specific DNA recombinase